MPSSKGEVILNGAALCDGIAIGSGHFLTAAEETIPIIKIHSGEADSEIERYRNALASSREELLGLQNYMAREGGDAAASIIDTHIQMLEDPIITEVEDRIRHQLQNTETVFRSVISEYEDQFSKITDTYFQQRLVDVRDLSQRIMWHLRARHKKEIEALPKNSIILSKEIVPSDAAEALRSGAMAFVTHVGGATSHTALIAKSKGVPFVADIDLQSYLDDGPFDMIVDGNAGKVILHPSKETLEKYQTLLEEHVSISKKQQENAHLPSATTDGEQINVMANIESIEDMTRIVSSGAAGIGLFRSEYLFLQEDSATSEERQSAVYRRILEIAGDMPVTFRLFDVGGDKDFCPTFVPQTNPALGCRAIRFLLQRPEVFRIQVRALLRAGAGFDLRILLPLVSDIDELKAAKMLILIEQERLRKKNVALPKNLHIGAMMEVPSAIIMADLMAQECDFFSIGTNDLTQYALASDRSDPKSGFAPAHPSILRMIAKAAKEARHHQIPISLCGDLAADPKFTPLLIGLGVRTLSCPPRYIPAIKEAVRRTCLKDARALAAEAMDCSTYKDVLGLI
ncbi:MAG: phosphoenolpyruvate--protein phosphotransferase [Chlamydiia bacterium]|nr:phosphoenolpyruvate--protein phosphotransferase [Chlamydiia bacterium]MCP5510105.1 phosphoenolpyruvate--protein phosphotransferase [Chlamydiales bacterium]HPE84999.1 phosphoenolpyruvate--protein phosphotransferase [Chlamydiales bacterium]